MLIGAIQRAVDRALSIDQGSQAEGLRYRKQNDEIAWTLTLLDASDAGMHGLEQRLLSNVMWVLMGHPCIVDTKIVCDSLSDYRKPTRLSDGDDGL